MFYAGYQKKELLRKYIRGIECAPYETNPEQVLVISCDVLTIGVLYPFKWWTKSKTATLICTNCKNMREINAANLETFPKNDFSFPPPNT